MCVVWRRSILFAEGKPRKAFLLFADDYEWQPVDQEISEIVPPVYLRFPFNFEKMIVNFCVKKVSELEQFNLVLRMDKKQRSQEVQEMVICWEGDVICDFMSVHRIWIVYAVYEVSWKCQSLPREVVQCEAGRREYSALIGTSAPVL